MADYQRFVSYLYEYQRNTKSKNCGFCRVEIRDHNCHLEIHLKLPVYPFVPTLKVFVFFSTQDKLYGIFLGNASYQHGNVSGSFSFSDQNILGSGYKFSELGGILIQSDTSLCFGSAWKDIHIQPEKFVILEKKTSTQTNSSFRTSSNTNQTEHGLPSATAETPLAQSESESYEPDTEAPSAISIEAEILLESNTSPQTKMQGTSQRSELAKETKYSSELPQQETLSETEQPPQHSASEPSYQQSTIHTAQTPQPTASEPSYQQSTIHTAQTSQHSANKLSEPEIRAASTDTLKTSAPPQPDNLWEHILKSYPQCHQFFDDEIHNCVQLSPRDVQKITASGYPLGNNAFFKHNCQSFQHFLLGKKECSGKVQYIIAVPGLYNAKEQYMASMFGFPHFKPSQNSHYRNNCWGYWYRFIPEHWNQCRC